MGKPDEVLIDAVDVGERDRTELGDLSELRESIASVGLLHPVVVTADHRLVAGDRRLAAVRELGWARVPVTVVDLDTAAEVLRAELDENTARKPLTPYEASRARERRAKVLAPRAAENKGGRPPKPRAEYVCFECGDVFGALVWHCTRCDHHHGMDRGQCNNCHEQDAPAEPTSEEIEPPETSSNLDEVSPTTRATRKVAAVGTGYSGSTLDKVDRLRDVAERGVIRRGKTEVPAPPEVREVASKALDGVKQTGAAIDRGSRQVESAIARYVEDDPDVTATRYRSAAATAYKRTREGLLTLDPERLAQVEDGALRDSFDRLAGDLERWVAAVRAARRPDNDVIPMRGRV